jgi:hypothetical protein
MPYFNWSWAASVDQTGHLHSSPDTAKTDNSNLINGGVHECSSTLGM